MQRSDDPHGSRVDGTAAEHAQYAEWLDGELLALGISPQGAIARVFLGSEGAKIVRHSPVLVLILPN
ncbi:universal stress protein [Mycolicibacterium sp. 050158]|uniref:universal stress protein n=1 Tax=Mycolicibacterium sp. 050158 TaxID=3090602 RepID=UPI0039A5C7E5